MTIYGGDFMGGLTAYIANLSMNMAQYNVQNQASLSMLKNTMESQEASSNILIESQQRLLRNSDENIDNYDIVIFYEALFRNAGGILTGKEKTVIIFSAFENEIVSENKFPIKPYSPKEK